MYRIAFIAQIDTRPILTAGQVLQDKAGCPPEKGAHTVLLQGRVFQLDILAVNQVDCPRVLSLSYHPSCHVDEIIYRLPVNSIRDIDIMQIFVLTQPVDIEIVRILFDGVCAEDVPRGLGKDESELPVLPYHIRPDFIAARAGQKENPILVACNSVFGDEVADAEHLEFNAAFLVPMDSILCEYIP